MAKNQLSQQDYDHLIDSFAQQLWFLRERWEGIKALRIISRPIPAIILTSDQTFDFQDLIVKGILPSDTPMNFGPIAFQAHLNGQKRLTRLLNARQITNTHAGHYIQTEQPQLVIDSIREIVDKVRTSKQ